MTPTDPCTYPNCTCVVSTSTSQPEPVCPRGYSKPKSVEILRLYFIAADSNDPREWDLFVRAYNEMEAYDHWIEWLVVMGYVTEPVEETPDYDLYLVPEAAKPGPVLWGDGTQPGTVDLISASFSADIKR